MLDDRELEELSLLSSSHMVWNMKPSFGPVSALVGTALAAQNTTAINSAQPDHSALAAKFEILTDSFLTKALNRLDERESCAKDRGEQSTCTRDNVVLRKE